MMAEMAAGVVFGVDAQKAKQLPVKVELCCLVPFQVGQCATWRGFFFCSFK